jgi:hypothetical protein
VNFTIGLHPSGRPPDNAIDMLWEQLGPSRGEASFARAGNEIHATWGIDSPVGMERDEREEIGRMAVLEIVREVCLQSPELELDWFAVGVSR